MSEIETKIVQIDSKFYPFIKRSLGWECVDTNGLDTHRHISANGVLCGHPTEKGAKKALNKYKAFKQALGLLL